MTITITKQTSPFGRQVYVHESETNSNFTIDAQFNRYGSKAWSKATVNWSACGSVSSEKALAFASALTYCARAAELLDAEIAAEVAAEADVKEELPENPEACPGCGCLPGDGITSTCYHPDGCGHNRAHGGGKKAEKCAACTAEAHGGNACTQHGGV